MTDTVVSSPTRETVIGFGRPFVMIGERINPTGRKLLAAEMREGDFSRVERDAVAQVEAGARMLDVNAGIPLADEPAILAETVRLVQALVDVPLSIESSIIEALAAGLEAYEGKALVNSSLDTVPPSSPSPTTRPGSLKIPTSDSRSPARSSIGLPTTASPTPTSSSIRSSCRSGP